MRKIVWSLWWVIRPSFTAFMEPQSVQFNACQEKVCFHKLRNCRAEYFQQYGLNMKILARMIQINEFCTGNLEVKSYYHGSPARPGPRGEEWQWITLWYSRWPGEQRRGEETRVTHCKSGHRQTFKPKKICPLRRFWIALRTTISTTHIRNSKVRNWNLEAECLIFEMQRLPGYIWDRSVRARENRPTWIRSAG